MPTTSDRGAARESLEGAVLFSMAAFGLYAMAGQIILIREALVVFYGSELSLGLIFASWLLWVSIGAAVAAWTLPRLGSPSRAMVLCLLLALAVLPAQTVLVRCLRGILGTPPGLLLPLARMVPATLAALLPLSFLVGFTFPLGSSLLAASPAGAARRIGSVYVSETMGSVLGAVIFTLWMAGRVAHIPAQGLLALPLVAACALLGWRTFRGVGRMLPAGIAAGLALALLLGGARWDEETVRLRWKFGHPGIEMAAWADSRYQHLAVARLEGQVTVYGNGMPLFSLPDDYGAAMAAHTVLCQQPHPARVLLLGGGTPEMVREILKHPVEHLDVVEIDPALVDITRAWASEEERRVLGDPRVAVRRVDGRSFLARAGEPYDVVLSRLPDPSTAMLNRFYTLEFFEDVRAHLAVDGTFAFDAGGAVEYVGEEVGPYQATLYRTLGAAFPHVLATPGDRNVFLASESPDALTTNPDLLRARYEKRGIETPYFSPALFASILQPARVDWLRRELEAVDVRSLNRDSRPVSYFQHVLLWDRFSGSGIGPLLRVATRLRPWMAATALAVLAAAGVLWVVRVGRGRRTACAGALSTLATTGLAAMGIQLVVLLSFQNRFGYVYEKVGLITATFLVGLFLGARVSGAWLTRSARTVRNLGILDGTILLLCLALPALLGAAGSLAGAAEAWHYALSLLAGILTALEFPLAAQLYLENRPEVARAAGLVDGADHAGAAFGALVTGSLLVPLFGFAGTCVLLAAVKGGNLIFLLSGAGRGAGGAP